MHARVNMPSHILVMLQTNANEETYGTYMAMVSNDQARMLVHQACTMLHQGDEHVMQLDSDMN